MDKSVAVSKFAIDAMKNRLTTNQVLYWMNMGFTEVDSVAKVKEKQQTFSLSKCIDKFGEEIGRDVYTERQHKWQNSLLLNGKLKYGFSGISQELFNMILEKCVDKDSVFYATKNFEFRLPKEDGGIWLYDFVDINKKKIIEYNGDIYHANPFKYASIDKPHPFNKNITAGELWIKDFNKIKIAKANGYDVLVVWDSAYKKQKVDILNKCLNFLNLK